MQLLLKPILRQECKLRQITLTVDGNVMELHRGEFGYFKCTGCANHCERYIEWEKLFCMVCPQRKSCNETGKVKDRLEDQITV